MNINIKHVNILKKVMKIKRMFLHYGFLQSPLTTKNIISLINRGKTKDQIFDIGCDINSCGNIKSYD